MGTINFFKLFPILDSLMVICSYSDDLRNKTLKKEGKGYSEEKMHRKSFFLPDKLVHKTTTTTKGGVQRPIDSALHIGGHKIHHLNNKN